MTDNTTTKNTGVRQAYEPVTMKVVKVNSQGVLCQSGVGGDPVVNQWSAGSTSDGSI